MKKVLYIQFVTLIVHPNDCVVLPELCVVYQTPPNQIIERGLELMTLYCIPTLHSVVTEFEWFCAPSYQEHMFPSSPVVYIDQLGEYGCRVRHMGAEVASQLISISLLPCKLNMCIQ